MSSENRNASARIEFDYIALGVLPGPRRVVEQQPASYGDGSQDRRHGATVNLADTDSSCARNDMIIRSLPGESATAATGLVCRVAFQQNWLSGDCIAHITQAGY